MTVTEVVRTLCRKRKKSRTPHHRTIAPFLSLHQQGLFSNGRRGIGPKPRGRWASTSSICDPNQNHRFEYPYSHSSSDGLLRFNPTLLCRTHHGSTFRTRHDYVSPPRTTIAGRLAPVMLYGTCIRAIPVCA